MEIEPVAYFKSPVSGKFGIPRQAGLVPELRGTVSFCGEFARPEALKGLEDFDFLWLIWGFDKNPGPSGLTVRPPRLGGNSRVGVFASRSPFRPNGIGLSSVRIARVDAQRCEIEVLGADLADGTPIYDVKPYVEYADSHPGVRSGFVDSNSWHTLEVYIPDEIASGFTPEELSALRGLLSQDPRPQYHDDPSREYGLSFAGRNVRFRVQDSLLSVTECFHLLCDQR